MKTTTPTRKTRRRPSRSAARPPSSRNPPNVIAYAVMTHCRFSREKSSDLPIEGSATLTIETSRIVMKNAAQTTASAFQRCGSSSAMSPPSHPRNGRRDVSGDPSRASSGLRDVSETATACDNPSTGSDLAERDRLRAFPERQPAELGKLLEALDDRGEVVARERAGLRAERAVAVREQQLGLADAARDRAAAGRAPGSTSRSRRRCRARGRPTGSSSTRRSSGSG